MSIAFRRAEYSKQHAKKNELLIPRVTATSTMLSTAAPLSTSTSPAPRSSLTEQLEDEGNRTPRSSSRGLNTTPKPRSYSDAPKTVLSPSPAFKEPHRRISKDDTAVDPPVTPRRPGFHIRGLSLTMPLTEGSGDSLSSRVPLSPKLETSSIYGSPASLIPRRSRGLDYTRAATNLHHSTLAESSPDASPITGRGIQIPQRRSMGGSTVLDSPSNIQSSLWSTMPERTTLSSSVSSVNMLDSGSDGDTSSDEDMAIDRDLGDPILNTPAASRLNGALAGGITNSPGGEWMNPQQQSPAHASLMSLHPALMSFRRARTRKGKSQHSSSSVSMNSSKPSPGPLSPGVMKSVESNGYFGNGMTRQQVQSRRESLSLGTDNLQLSDSEESNHKQTQSDMDAEGPRGVIRRAVTRRGNLLPKTKGFARIRAALLEESAPIDSEAKREAEVIRQVQDNDPSFSPHKSPPDPFVAEAVESIEEAPLNTPGSHPPSFPGTFSQQAEKNSAGLGFWTGFEDRYRTPPPSLLPRDSSSALSDETSDTAASLMITADHPAFRHFNRSRSRSTTPLANHGNAPTAGDVARRVNNKRRRDDDWDTAFTKRRAVSPGMSVQSSPVLPQSPVMTSDKAWGKPPSRNNGNGNGNGTDGAGERRSNSGGSISGMKKVGLQGMTETNEGIMSMSID
jgi:hypothetical protein